MKIDKFPQMDTKQLPFLLMLMVLIAAFVFRLRGIWFGYPLAIHPDEPAIVNAAFNIIQTGDLNPHFFNYPTLTIYLQALLYTGVAFCEKLFISIPISEIPEIEFYLWGRTLNVLISTATIFITYEIGRRLFNAWVGLLAVCFIGASYLHVTNSFSITPDSSVAFWSALSTLMAVMIYTEGSKRWYYIAGGIFAGFAMGTKYTAFVAVMPICIAHIYQARRNKGWADINILMGLAAVPVAFLFTTPYAVLDSRAFMEAIDYERYHYSSGHPGAASSTNTSFVVYLKYLFLEGYGVLPTVFAVAGMLWQTVKDYWKTILLLSFPLLIFLFVGQYKVFFSRNIVAAIPYLSLFSGICVYEALSRLPQMLFPQLAWRRKLIGIAGITLILVSLYGQVSRSVQEIRTITLPDTRWEGVQWVINNLPPGARIGREHYTPPIEKYSAKYNVVYLELFGLLKGEDAGVIPELDFIILSSGDYSNFVEHPELYPVQAGRYNAFFVSNELVKEFVPDGESMGGPIIRIYKIRRQ